MSAGGALADAALEAAVAATGPGAFEGDILAELQGRSTAAAATIRRTSRSSARGRAR